jgi:hypothetical protein
MSITLGNADKYKTDEMTVSGRDICIRITETGFYYIDVSGPGDKPALCDHRFTNLSEARKAIQGYVEENRAEINKKKMIIENAAKEYPRRGQGAKTNTE